MAQPHKPLRLGEVSAVSRQLYGSGCLTRAYDLEKRPAAALASRRERGKRSESETSLLRIECFYGQVQWRYAYLLILYFSGLPLREARTKKEGAGTASGSFQR